MPRSATPVRTKISPDRFEFRRLRKPIVQGGLSSTVLVEDTGYVNLGFNYSLVKRAGMILPRGVSTKDPAFMLLKFSVKEGLYKLYVQYVGQKDRYLLLDLPERPAWIDRPTRIAAKINKEETP